MKNTVASILITHELLGFKKLIEAENFILANEDWYKKIKGLAMTDVELQTINDWRNVKKSINVFKYHL